jgi:predicted alpha/beta-hydrolase family hydrolase
MTAAREVATPTGPARVHLHRGGGVALLVLGHGAGGGVTAPDLQAATKAALETGFDVALVEQPYRVAGRRSPAPAARLDEAWRAVVAAVAGDDRPLVTGGRSSGARVACRTAADTGARGVLCLAFPVHPPGRPDKTRLPELDGVDVPVLVVQGDRDPFGMPPTARGRKVVVLQGDHGLKKEHARLRDAVAGWLQQFV